MITNLIASLTISFHFRVTTNNTIIPFTLDITKFLLNLRAFLYAARNNVDNIPKIYLPGADLGFFKP